MFTTIHLFSQADITLRLENLYSEKKYDQILNDYEKNVNDYSAKSIYYIGMAHYMKANDNKCIELMNLSIEKDKSDPDPHYIKGMTFNYLNKFDDAIESFKKAIELFPESADYHSGLADSYFNKEEFLKAFESYKVASQVNDELDRPFYMMPQALFNLNKKEEALEYFYLAKNEIDKTTESYITVLYNIGLMESLNRNYVKAEPVFSEIIKLNPKDYSAYSKLIQAYYGMKEYAKSKTYKDILYKAFDNGELVGTGLEEMFCFDQFDWNDKFMNVLL